MKITFSSAIVLLLLSTSCTNNAKQPLAATAMIKDTLVRDTGSAISSAADERLIGQPIISTDVVLKDFRSFWSYYTDRVKLYDDFTAFDPKGQKIGKGAFLKQLKTGKYFPLVLHAKANILSYRLEKITRKSDPVIAGYMKQFSAQELIFYNMLGKSAPSFHFTDINGKVYTPENTKGKIVLLKCWFIGCVACVEEMPALNELVAKYKNRTDILFVSLAPDSKEKLTKFFQKTHFDYAKVFEQGAYMTEKLKVNSYPTHFVIGKDGKLIRVVQYEEQLAEVLNRLII
jgi:peroxiredoxin